MGCPHLNFLAFLSHYTPPLTNHCQSSLWLSGSSGGTYWPTTLDLPPLLSFTTQGQPLYLPLIMLNCSNFTGPPNVCAASFYITHRLYLELCVGTCMVFIVCSVDLVSFCLCLESTLVNTYCHSYSPVKSLDLGTSSDLEFVLVHCTLPTGPLVEVTFVH